MVGLIGAVGQSATDTCARLNNSNCEGCRTATHELHGSGGSAQTSTHYYNPSRAVHFHWQFSSAPTLQVQASSKRQSISHIFMWSIVPAVDCRMIALGLISGICSCRLRR